MHVVDLAAAKHLRGDYSSDQHAMMGNKRRQPAPGVGDCKEHRIHKQQKMEPPADTCAWLALELAVINTSDPATLFKMYQVNRRCTSLVCSTIQQQLLRHLQGILPHPLNGGLPFAKLKWLLTCAGSSTLNQPQVIEALLQLLDPLSKADALQVIQIAAGAGLAATDRLVLAAARRRCAHMDMLVQVLASQGRSHVKHLNPLFAAVLLGDNKNETTERLGIKPLSAVLHDITADTLPNLLRLACCRHKHSTAAHALLNHDATHLGLLHGYHASATCSSSSSSASPSHALPREPGQQQALAQERQQAQEQAQQCEDEQAERQWVADLVSDCMESCIIRDNYEVLESLVTLPPAGLIGTSSIRRLIYLGILYAAAHGEQADMDEQEASLDALDLMLQLPGAQELSTDAIADLVQTCGDLRLEYEAQLLTLPNALRFSCKQLCDLLLAAFMSPHSFGGAVGKLIHHRDLESADVRDLMLTSITRHGNLRYVFEVLVQLRLGRHLNCADVDTLYRSCLTLTKPTHFESRDEDVRVALQYMRKLAPAAAQPAPPTLKALFAIGVQATGSFSHFPELLQLPACKQLQPQDWLEVLAHCLDMCCSLPPFVMLLPAAQQMDSSAILQLLQQAAQLQAFAVLPQLAVLPAAAQLAKHELLQLLSGLVQQGDVQGAGCLMQLPGAQMLTGKHFQRLRKKAVRAQQWSCALWLQRQPQLAELQWQDMKVTRLQPLVLTAAQEGDMTAVLALLQLRKASRLQPEHVTALVTALLGERRCSSDSSARKQKAKAVETAALDRCLARVCELRAVRKLQSGHTLQMLQAGMQHKQGLGVSHFARLPAAQQLTTAELRPLLQEVLLTGPCHAGWLEFLRLPGQQQMDADRIYTALYGCIWKRCAAGGEHLVHMMLQLPAASNITAAQIAGLAGLACRGSQRTTASIQWVLQLPNAQALSEAQVKPWLRNAVVRSRDSGLGAAVGRIPAVAASTDAELQLLVRLLQSAPRPGDEEVQIVV